jgi:hypothetical protein
MTSAAQHPAPPTSRPRAPREVMVAGIVGLVAAAGWFVGTYWFWYYEPFLPMLGSVVFGVAIVLAWRGGRVARIVATAAGVAEGVYYGPGGLLSDALCLLSLVMLYLPPSNAYFRPRYQPQPPS